MAGLALSALSAIGSSGLGGALALGGTVLSTAGAISSGNAQKAASDFQAAQLDAAGKAEQAAATQQAEQDRRQGRIVESRARAVGAASGGGIDITLLGQIEQDAELKAQTSMWQGEEASKGRSMQAGAARYEGSQYKKAGLINAGSTLLSGGASFLDKYA